jgi:hypothetical protein
VDELDFEEQWNYYKRICGDTDYAFAEAAETHSLFVVERLRDCSLELQQLISLLKNKDSQKYLAYGALRRVSMIVNSYNSLRAVCHYDRTKPLSPESRRDLDRDINMVYINIRGVMDNLAWSFLLEKDSQVIKNLNLEKKKTLVGLFSKDIRKASPHNFWKIINDKYGNWAKEFATKRDPAAHGLPMYVIPKFFESDDQRELAEKLDGDAMNAILNNQFELAEDLSLQSQNLGTFKPFFSSDPTEKWMPLYPVVSIDISKLVYILRYFESEIKI